MDAVWENIIIQIGGIRMDHGNTLDEQIVVDEQRMKIQKEIDRLTKAAKNEKQPKKKFELAQQINKLKQELEVWAISKFDYDPIPESLCKSMEISEKLRDSVSPLLEQQDRIQRIEDAVSVPKLAISSPAMDEI